MIEIDALTFRYGDEFRLDIPALTIDAGERVALIGPSGTGKTTLLNLVSGITTCQGGRIQVGDVRVDQLNDTQRRDFRAKSIGFVFQDFELVDYLNVEDNILHPYRLNSALRLTRDVRKRVGTVAEQLAIGDKLKRDVRHLSQGERQRVAIARALLAAPALILADEPTGNLDPKNKTRILELLFEYTASAQATMLVVTHDHALLDSFDRVVDFADFFEEG